MIQLFAAFCETVNYKVEKNWLCAILMTHAVVELTAADDGVVTIDDDSSEASMMRMMGFSDFNSTKASLHCVLRLV